MKPCMPLDCVRSALGIVGSGQYAVGRPFCLCRTCGGFRRVTGAKAYFINPGFGCYINNIAV